MNIEKSEDKDLGMETIERVYKDLNIQPQWSSVFNRGFVSWCNNQLQRVWAEDPCLVDDRFVTKVNVETDLIGPEFSTPKLQKKLVERMLYASLSGPVICRQTGSVKLRCGAFISEDNKHSLVQLLCLAARLQYEEALVGAEEIARSRVKDPCSNTLTPSAPLVPFPSEVQLKNSSPTYPPQDLFRMLSDQLTRLGYKSTVREQVLIGLVPFGSSIATLSLCAREKHPVYGAGLVVLLELPSARISTKADADLVLKLNSADADSLKTGHFLGSWCIGPQKEGRKYPLWFLTFIPIAWCTQGIVWNIILGNLERCDWAHRVLADGCAQLRKNGIRQPEKDELMFDDWENEEDQEALEANRREEKRKSDQDFEDLRYEIEQEIIPHILEDVCPTCPIDAARTYVRDFNVTTCDPRGYHGNCGIAELRLRAKHLFAREEVR